MNSKTYYKGEIMKYLTREKKLFLDKILHPTIDSKFFLENDLNVQLRKILPNKKIFSDENLIDEIREKNKWKCFKIIGDFLIKYPYYLKSLYVFFANKNLEEIINLVLINYVRIEAQKNKTYRDINFTLVPECILFQK